MNWLDILAHPHTLLARLWRKIRLALNPNQRSIFKLEDGLLFECALGDSAGRILTVGSLERLERQFVRHWLKPGDVFFDVGANLGLFTVTGARRVGPAGHVYAFEPSQREAGFLQRNLERNGLSNVTVVTAALSDHSGTAQFAVAADGGNNSLMKNEHPQQRIQYWQTVPLTTLDEYVAAHSIERIALIKIDVEGGEANVLRGAAGLLSGPNAPAVLAEFCDMTAAGFQSSGHKLYEALATYGYQIFSLSDIEDVALEPVASKDHYDYENLVARKVAGRQAQAKGI